MAYNSTQKIWTDHLVNDTDAHDSIVLSVGGMDSTVITVTAAVTEDGGDAGDCILSLYGSTDGTNWVLDDTATLTTDGTAKLRSDDAWNHVKVTVAADAGRDAANYWTVSATSSTRFYTGRGPDRPTSPANTITVGLADCDYKTVQTAINAASAGDMVKVYPGTYTGQITMKTGVDVVGVGHGAIIQHAGANSNVANAAVVFNGVTDCRLRNIKVTTSTSATVPRSAIGIIDSERITVEGCDLYATQYCVNIGGETGCSDIKTLRNIMQAPNPINLGTSVNTICDYNTLLWSGKAFACFGAIDVLNATGGSFSHNHVKLAEVGEAGSASYVIRINGSQGFGVKGNFFEVSSISSHFVGFAVDSASFASTLPSVFNGNFVRMSDPTADAVVAGIGSFSAIDVGLETCHVRFTDNDIVILEGTNKFAHRWQGNVISGTVNIATDRKSFARDASGTILPVAASDYLTMSLVTIEDVVGAVTFAAL